MAELRLSKLPDRTPVKITITVSPELNVELLSYAKLYQQTYGAAETVPELIPYMLEAFLQSDRSFAKMRRERSANNTPAARVLKRPIRPPRGVSTDSSPTAS